MSQTTYSTSITKAYPGMIATNVNHTIESRVSTEATNAIPFGVFVVSDASTGAAGDLSAKMPSASSGQAFLGVVTHSHAYATAWTDRDGVVHGELNSTGLVPKTTLNVMVVGRVWVNCETACAPGDPVFVRYTTDGGSPAFTQQGSVGNASGTGRTLDLTSKARFLTTAAAPAQGSYVLAEIELMMTA